MNKYYITPNGSPHAQSQGIRISSYIKFYYRDRDINCFVDYSICTLPQDKELRVIKL